MRTISVGALVTVALLGSPAARAQCLDPAGDVDGDGITNVTDVQCAILAVLWELDSPLSPPPSCLNDLPERADLDCDADRDVVDLVALIRLALDLPLATADANGNDCHDACEPPVYEVEAQLVWSGFAGVKTPPTWNAHLPKLASDGEWMYAVHTHYAPDAAQRLAHILERPAADPGAPWTIAATVSYPHQPPGIVMDTAGRLHMVFGCMRPGSVDVQCFQGGAGTAGLAIRFYHLIFAAKDGDGSLRFDTYANYSEWTQATNGYLGLGTTEDGVTWWSLADAGWSRWVQWWSGPASYGTSTALTWPSSYLLYPIHAAHPTLGAASLVLYTGAFDPKGGNNAAYKASVGYSGTLSAGGLSQLVVREPEAPEPGSLAAYPSDVAWDLDGRLLLLSYLPDATGACTELLSWDGALSEPPAVHPVGCLETYAKIQPMADGSLLVLASASAGPIVQVGRSTDGGASWHWQQAPLLGLPATGDVRYFGYTPVKPYTSPLSYDPSRVVFLFSGADAGGFSKHTYVGILQAVQ